MKDSKRIIGWGAVAFGGLCVLVGSSPFVRALHWEGILIGLGAFGAGAWILLGPELRESIRKAFRLWVQSAGRARKSRSRRAVVTGIDPLLPVRILKLAREKNGILTVAEVAIGLDVPLDHAEQGLAECVRAGNAVPDYDMSRAHAVFRFPEFIPPDTHSLSN